MQFTIDEKLTALNQISEKKLLNILSKIIGRKDLIIDCRLIKPLEHIIGVTKLRAHGVDKIYKFEKAVTPYTNTQRVFFILGDLITVKNVCDKINSEISQKNDGNCYHIIMLHRKLGCAMRLLEEEGVIGYVTVHCFQWELITLDNRILSLEFPNFYKITFVEGDQSYLPCVAKSLWTLYMLFGKPLVNVIQGKYAHLVDQMLQIYCEELQQPPIVNNDVSCFVIVDRDIDYASTLMTGGTYCSLLDEVFDIRSGFVEMKTTEDDQQQMVSYKLTSKDETFANIKNRHFSDVFPYLSAKTKDLNAEYKRTKEMSVQEMKRYVSEELYSLTNLKKTVSYHIATCESIISKMGDRFEGLQNTERDIIEGRNRKDCVNYIEDCLAMNTCEKFAVLRLICLLSLSQDGLTSDEYQKLRTQFLHVYGYQHLTGLHNLERLSLCVEQQGIITEIKRAPELANKVVQAVSLPNRKSAFVHFSQKLKLLPEFNDNYDLKNPKDLGYVFGGSYIPAVCQLVHLLIKQEISFDELSKRLPNMTIKTDRMPVVLRSFVVYFIGGVTYAEISAFQLLEKLSGAKIIVSGTSITNGNKIMKSYF